VSLAPLSSGRDESVVLVVEECLKDGIGEAALEYAKCLASAVPTVLPPFDHLFGRRMPTGLGECDPVQGSVQLAVPGAAQPVPGLVRRPHRQRCGAVVAGVGVTGFEPVDTGGLTYDLGRGQRATTR
jgi:hypothetical protein